jgi:hypothetical protein
VIPEGVQPSVTSQIVKASGFQEHHITIEFSLGHSHWLGSLCKHPHSKKDGSLRGKMLFATPNAITCKQNLSTLAVTDLNEYLMDRIKKYLAEC